MKFKSKIFYSFYTVATEVCSSSFFFSKFRLGCYIITKVGESATPEMKKKKWALHSIKHSSQA